MSAKLTREDLISLACDGQEIIIARNVPHAAIKHISLFPTHEERQFALRCFWVPYEMVGICQKQFLSPKGRAGKIWQFAVLIAHGRMLREMCAWGHDPRVSWWINATAADACKWWMGRYDSYLSAIDASFHHWMKRKCPDCCHEQPELAAASRYGFIQRIDVEGLPANCVSGVLTRMKEQEKHGSRESEFFYKNAKGIVEPRWDYPDIDLWLIEIWPLVEQYGWTYKEVCELAFHKFGGDNTMVNASVLNNSKALKERCQKELGLCLSPLAQQRKGRPKKCDDVTGIAWFGGKVYEKVAERAKSPDPKVGSHGPAAFQKLAEMAVNIEPFTRLLDKSSKEKLPVACPNLKIGDKKTASPPPFFVAPSS